jgi:hypothetical protein
MNLAGFGLGLSLDWVFAEHIRESRLTEDRATALCLKRRISREDARIIAVFSRGGWAQNYPFRGHDLGEDFALHVADWLSTRALGPTSKNMDAALRTWRGGEFYGWMMLAIAGV